MQTYTRLFLAAIVIMPFLANAQIKLYQHDTTVKVYAYGREQTLAWCGGFNNPQFSMADLNNDGLQDLVVYEYDNSVRTFLNKGTSTSPQYRYSPEYALNFPPILAYLVLADYNCDGVADLFHRGGTGIEVYTGYYNAESQLCFRYYKDIYYGNDTSTHGPANAYNNPGDIPSIVDVDNDGDLDIISYDILGGHMNWYKNMRVEHGLPCDSLDIILADRCWGKVFQGPYRTHTLNQNCSEVGLDLNRQSGARTTHSGNTPCLFDWDMDGDYDYLDGSVSYNEMTFLKNGKVETGGRLDTMVYQDTMWQSNVGGKQVEITQFPAAFNLDIDGDGKKDLLISPNLQSSENYHSVWFYKNYSTPGNPDWRFQSDSFLTDMTIDAGSNSYPAFFDYDKDGKPDLFVGSNGYFQTSTGLLRGKLSYYKNTSTAGHPSFTLQTDNFLNLFPLNFSGIAPAMGDIDNDGKADLIIGTHGGTLSYFKNIAANDSVTPNWSLQQLDLKDEDGNVINVINDAAPYIYDIDKDGKKDLIIGSVLGYILYYQNVSTVPGTIKLRLINEMLGNARADSNYAYFNYSTPFIGPLDSTGVDYLLMGSSSGNIYQFTGFQSGDTTAIYTMLDGHYAYIDTLCNAYNDAGTTRAVFSGLRTSVAVGDINNDGNYYMAVGNNKGGLEMFKLKVYTPDTTHPHVGVPVVEQGKINVFPNPVGDKLTVKWTGIMEDNVQISFMNMEGQILFTEGMPASTGFTHIPVDMLTPGMYVCILQSGINKYYSKFTVVR